MAKSGQTPRKSSISSRNCLGKRQNGAIFHHDNQERRNSAVTRPRTGLGLVRWRGLDQRFRLAPGGRYKAMAQTIALVDDDRNILTSVQITLEAEGFTVRTYTDGAEALRAL